MQNIPKKLFSQTISTHSHIKDQTGMSKSSAQEYYTLAWLLQK